MLLDSSVVVEARGKRVELAGVDPRTWLEQQKSSFAEVDADLRILLCHFPRALDLVAAGALGPDPGRATCTRARSCCRTASAGSCSRIRPRAYSEGVFERDGTVMHVSPGLGTTFVPFRFFARPEATELVLRSRN